MKDGSQAGDLLIQQANTTGFYKAAAADRQGTGSLSWLASAICWPLLDIHGRRRVLFPRLTQAFVSFWEEFIANLTPPLARAAWLTHPLSRADSRPQVDWGKSPGPAAYDSPTLCISSISTQDQT